MPTEAEKVRSWGTTGNDPTPVKSALLTLAGILKV